MLLWGGQAALQTVPRSAVVSEREGGRGHGRATGSGWHRGNLRCFGESLLPGGPPPCTSWAVAALFVEGLVVGDTTPHLENHCVLYEKVVKHPLYNGNM